MEYWQLEQLQGLPLDIKIEKTKLRIREWYEHFEGNVYVSFSGGKDSTVLLHLVRSLYPDVKAVFSDTGLEFPEIREFVKSIDNVEWVKPTKNFKKILEEEGYPIISKQNALFIRQAQTLPKDSKSYKLRMEGWNSKRGEYGAVGKIPDKWMFLVDSDIKVSEMCCFYMKKQPIHLWEKSNGNPKPFIGTLAEESQARMKQYLTRGCNAFESKQKQSSQPLGFWTEQDILLYLKTFNLDYAKVYGYIVEDENGKLSTTGESRTGCIFCGFGAHLESSPNRFQRLEITHPKLHEYCMKPKEEGGLGLAYVLDVVGVEWKNK